GEGDKLTVGAPTVSGASVTVEILDNVKARKVVAYKYRRREGYHRTVGHRQKLTRVKVSKIAA
ncbi:MAG: 50S ribosomal protein L21, partial [Candidatus Methylacidiphilales bacterium]